MSEDLAQAGGDAARPSARADLYGGAFWIVLGGAIAVGSWNMDRLERMGVSFFTAPGLVPGILGLLLIVCGAVLSARALRDGALGTAQRAPVLLEAGTLRRAGLTLLLTLGFALALVGHGLPFPVAAAAYLFFQIVVLQYPERKAKNEVGRGLLVAALVAVGAAAVVSTLFQEVFLVRLP
ncbi:MAG: tripartite tricarboxylate transporter TctB family protein [Candidatus Parcubacteria bacterium]|nr:tripartite tricarboxylate transporter TctB family protein [Burkholderiales bacterium]